MPAGNRGRDFSQGNPRKVVERAGRSPEHRVAVRLVQTTLRPGGRPTLRAGAASRNVCESQRGASPAKESRHPWAVTGGGLRLAERVALHRAAKAGGDLLRPWPGHRRVGRVRGAWGAPGGGCAVVRCLGGQWWRWCARAVGRRGSRAGSGPPTGTRPVARGGVRWWVSGPAQLWHGPGARDGGGAGDAIAGGIALARWWRWSVRGQGSGGRGGVPCRGHREARGSGPGNAKKAGSLAAPGPSRSCGGYSPSGSSSSYSGSASSASSASYSARRAARSSAPVSHLSMTSCSSSDSP